MTPDQVNLKFTINEPAILKLADSTPDSDGPNWVYSLTDGRTLSLPRHAAVKLGTLFLEPGEEFSIGRYRKSDSEPAEWVVSLTPRTEQLRAAKETTEAESKARAAAEETRKNLTGQLDASLQNLRKMPRSVDPLPPSGTGTYGAIPVPRPRSSRPQVEQIPYNVAFREVIAFVTKELNESGEQWSEQSRQDLASTCLISAAKAGILGVWER